MDIHKQLVVRMTRFQFMPLLTLARAENLVN